MKTEKREFVIYASLALVAAFIYYRRFLDNFFVMDDFKYLENMFAGPLSVILGYGNLRVVSNVAWWPLYELSGLNPFLYNLFGVVMHAANSALFSLLVLQLLKDRTLAMVSGAVFLLNAVGCDALFWKAANNTLIDLFFYLTALCLYVIYRQEGSSKFFVLSIGAYVLAIFSKEDAASLPFIIVLMELVFFSRFRDMKGIVLRTAPYIVAVLVYIVAGRVIFNYMLQSSVEHARFFKIRPLYSLLAGWTVFFLSPDGRLSLDSPAPYVTILFIATSFAWVKDKKLLLLGYGWIFFGFLPQSVASHGQLEPTYIINSISRYLYLPSAGAALILGAVVLSVRDRFPGKIGFAVAALFFCLFVPLNYGRVQARGLEWQQAGEPTARFLKAIKHSMPYFPPDSHIFIVNAPGGRAFMQQSLCAFYGDPGITWISNPATYRRKPGENAFLIICAWKDNGEDVDLEIRQFP